MANLFVQHPGGHLPTRPCQHLTQQHPGGDQGTVPCTHRPPHVPPWHQETVPCTHLVAQHPAGDEFGGPRLPCGHVLAPVRVEPALGLVFFTDSGFVQNQAIQAAQALQDLGVRIGAPRPLNIFHHDPISGNPNDSQDPMWSHYEPATHSVQIIRGQDQDNMRDALLHEMGHATLGHRCVRIPTRGGAHVLTQPSDPAVAMDEGWAHFIALAVGGGVDNYLGFDWENRMATVPKSPNIEYNVGCTLWDLLDPPDPPGRRDRFGADRVQVPFADLYRVYSPTLATLADGPVLSNVDDYLNRLAQNRPDLSRQIAQARLLNLG